MTHFILEISHLNLDQFVNSLLEAPVLMAKASPSCGFPSKAEGKGKPGTGGERGLRASLTDLLDI
jgi:hypothetical protein